ncbi:putative reverse transcriptase domain-containing protein [Tanacetum coccineum]
MQIIHVNLTQEPKTAGVKLTSLDMTYSVMWSETNVTFEWCFDVFLDYHFFEHQIHWFSVFNLFMMVIFLTRLVSMILMRTLRNDYAKYAREDDDLESLERDCISSSAELILHQPSPFVNLKSLKIYPEIKTLYATSNVSTLVESYFLDSSPGVTLTMVLRDVHTPYSMLVLIITARQNISDKSVSCSFLQMGFTSSVCKIMEIWCLRFGNGGVSVVERVVVIWCLGSNFIKSFLKETWLSSRRSRLDLYIISYLRDLSFAHLAKIGIRAKVIENQVMKAPVISISLDVSVENVGSSFLRVILIGSISIEVPVALEVGAAIVASPVGILELDIHSSSEVDPSKSSPPPVSVAPMVSPFMCLDDSESDTEIPKRRVSPTTSTTEIPTIPILPAPSAIIAPSSDYPLAPDIPIGRLYRTHPGGPCRALTMRKSVRPLPSHCLTLRYTSHHLDHFNFGSSSSHSSTDHSSSRHSISGHSLSGHTPPNTTDADSSTPLRFVHPPLTRTPQCSEAYLSWRSTPLSTMYPLTTSESSAGDSSSESSDRPSRKRCRSLAATVTSPIHVTRALVPSRADLLLPCKRFRDSISLKDSVKEEIDMDMLEDIDADATAVEVAVDRDVEVGIDAGIGMEDDVKVDVEDEVGDEVESSDRGTMEVGVDVAAGIDILDAMLMLNARIEDIETGQRELDSRSLIAGGERASLLDQNGSDDDNGNGGNGNGENGNGGNENPNENNRYARPVARECTYQDFIKCQPLNFKGTEGVVGLIRWFEKIETVFHISNYPEKYQVKYAACTLLNSALTWWNSHKRTVGTEAAFAMA